MKILFICNTPNSRNTGMAKIINYTADEMRRSGHDVDLIFREDVVSFGSFRRVSEILFPFLLFFPMGRLWKKKGKHDAVAIHSLEGAFYVLLRKFFKHLPPCLIISFGSDEMRWELELEEDKLGLRKLRKTTKFLYPLIWIGQARFATKYADHVIVSARSEISFYQQRYGMNPAGVTFVPNGAAEEYFISRDYKRPPRKLLFLGGWEWRKGILYLSEAFSQIAETMPQVTLSLVGVGTGGADVKNCFPDKLHSRINVLSKVSVEETPGIYAEHDIFVFPTLFESMSLVVPEAMASGMPVITTRTCGLQDAIENGKHGLLVSPRNSRELGDKIAELICSAELREKLGRSARERARELMNWSVVADTYVNVFKKMIEKNSLALSEDSSKTRDYLKS